MNSLIKNGMALLCLSTIFAVALPAQAKKDEGPQGWKNADTDLQQQIDTIQLIPGADGAPGADGTSCSVTQNDGSATVSSQLWIPFIQ